MNIFQRLYRRVVRTLIPPHPVINMVKPFTMLTPDRLESLLHLSKKLVHAQVAGAFVECGTCRGGSAAILAYVAKQEGWKRDLFLFDSFQGHPSFASENAPDREELSKWAGQLVASEEDVRSALRSVDAYAPEHVNIISGWFQDSLPQVAISEIALLHIDADWYDSVWYCLNTLFDRVVPNGYIVVDDYGHFPGCRIAVDKFVGMRADEIQFCYELTPARVYRRQVRRK